jgi:hypothetical protein
MGDASHPAWGCAVNKILFTRDGSVAYIPPAPGDAVETFVERAAAEFRKRGPRATLRGGVTMDDLRAAADAEPFELKRRKGARLVKVLGILIGGKK